MEVSIFYDSFIFVVIKRKYFIYKKEFYVLIIFVIKYDYFCKYPYHFVIVYIDYKFFIHFLSSDLYERIYGYWVNKFRRFNIDIQYISRYRNKIVDIFFKILFYNEDCFVIFVIINTQKKFVSERSKWIWKNDKKRFEKFLKKLDSSYRSEIKKYYNIERLSIFAFNITSENNFWKKIYEFFI